jgi:hypothetical protein
MPGLGSGQSRPLRVRLAEPDPQRYHGAGPRRTRQVITRGPDGNGFSQPLMGKWLGRAGFGGRCPWWDRAQHAADPLPGGSPGRAGAGKPGKNAGTTRCWGTGGDGGPSLTRGRACGITRPPAGATGSGAGAGASAFCPALRGSFPLTADHGPPFKGAD